MKRSTTRLVLGTVIGWLAITGAAQATNGARLHITGRVVAPVAHTHASLPALPAPSPGTVWFHLVASDGMRGVTRVERALVDQLAQVAAAWGTPPIRFGATGIPVYVESAAAVHAACLTDEAAGCHDLTPEEAIHVENFTENVSSGSINQDGITSALSHEIVEAMVDPDGSKPEACDPVAWTDYRVDGVVVSDWTYPAYWTGVAGPYDRLGTLHSPNSASR